jgi:hypothetical protein
VQTCGASGSALNHDDEDFRRANFYSIPILYGGPRGFYTENANLFAENMTDTFYNAFEINIYACVRTYDAHFSNGTGVAELVDTSYAINHQLSTELLNLTCPHTNVSDNESWMCNTGFESRKTMNTTKMLALKDPDRLDVVSNNIEDHYTIDAYTLATIANYLTL